MKPIAPILTVILVFNVSIPSMSIELQHFVEDRSIDQIARKCVRSGGGRACEPKVAQSLRGIV